MKKFLNWWKIWGQVWGFVLLVFVLSFTLLNESVQDFVNENNWAGIVWIILFFGGSGWYAWQSRVHGWRLPKDIRETH
jgi:hypothetical protein